MSLYLGIDTSNYTTSAAIYDSVSGVVTQEKMLLPVKSGEKGVRQSDAVFHHTRQLPQVIEALRQSCTEQALTGVSAIGVSTQPRRAEGSYMPCFTVGSGTAHILGSVTGIPVREFSHQEGHIAAALYSAGRLDLMESRFIAFHVSGGTTEAVLAEGDGVRLRTQLLASSLDLKAGQAIDRTAVMLGLPFPGGRHLESLAREWQEPIRYKPVMRGSDVSLSGVENQCRKMWDEGQPKEKIAKFCLIAVMNAIIGMTDALHNTYGNLPLLYAGGVMSNGMMQAYIGERFSDASFAASAFSCDNAAGVAILAALADKKS